MKKQELLQLVNENKKIGVTEIFQYFQCDTKNKQKRAEHIIKELVFDNLVHYDNNERTVSIPELSRKPVNRRPKINKNIEQHNKEPNRNIKNAKLDLDSIIEKYEIRKEFPISVMA